MKYATLQRAIADAQRFIDIASQCEPYRDSEGKIVNAKEPMVYPGKTAAAAKRASMDLTRTLADMRGWK